MVKKTSSDMDTDTGEARSMPKKTRPQGKNSSQMDTDTGEVRSVPKKKQTNKRKRQIPKSEKVTIRETKEDRPAKKVKFSISKGELFQIDITNPDFSGSKHRGTVDCVICTLEALGILSLSQGQNQRKFLDSDGITDDQIYYLMRNRYSGTEWNFQRIPFKELETFLSEIKRNHAIFVKLEGSEYCHAIVFYKTKNYTLGLMDFQMEPRLHMTGFEKIKKEYIEKYGFLKKFFQVLTYKFV